MNTDHIYAEISELKRDLESLSPKTSLYQSTLKKYEELQKLVGWQGTRAILPYKSYQHL